MNLAKYVKPGRIGLDLEASNKASAIGELLEILADAGAVPMDRTAEIRQALLERETQASTGLGYGVAIPHLKTDLVDEIQVAFGRSAEGIEFEAADGQAVHFVFLVLAPVQKACDYLKVLSMIAVLVKDKDNRRELLRAKTTEDIIKVLDKTA